MIPRLHVAGIAAVGLALGAAPTLRGGEARAQTPGARADSATEAERLGEEGRALYEEGRYAEAVARYLKAWHLSQSSSLLYNVAWIYDRKLQEKELALDYYRRYAKAADAEPDVLQRALDRIEALKQEVAGQRGNPGGGGTLGPGSGGGTPSGGGPGTGSGGGPGGGTAVASGPGGPGPGDLHGSGTTPSGSSALPWIVGGAGGALLVGGFVAGMVAQGTHDDFEASHDLVEKERLRDDGRSQALAADVLLVTGTLAVGAGVLLRLLDGGDTSEGSASGESPATTRFGAVPTGDGLVFVLGGSL